MSSSSGRSLADNLLRPRSVAIVGVSDDETKATARPLRFLRRSGFAGTVYPVNAVRTRVQGERAWPSIGDLPEVPDHVYVLTNADAAIAAVRQCGDLGIPFATVLANGFAESGPVGAARQQTLLEAARNGGVRVLGPNSLGVVNFHNGLVLTGNAAFAEPPAAVGDMLLVSQSGSAIGAYLSRGHVRGIGFAAMISVGGEADVSIGELCKATLDDPNINSYALFLESLQHAAHLAEFGVAAHARGKSVTVFKLGRSEQTAALTQTHTGAIAGSAEESRAFLAACGFSLVDNFESLIETPALLEGLRLPTESHQPRIAVLTTTGGGAALVVDELAARGFGVRKPSPDTFRALVNAGCPVSENLIVDLTLAGTTHDLVRSSLRILQRSGEFDLVLFVLGSSARFNPEFAVAAIVECADGETPLAAFVLPEAPQALAALQAAGIATFRTPESCASAVRAAFFRARPTIQTRHLGQTPEAGEGVFLDEAESAAIVEGQGIPVVPHVVLEAAHLTAPLVLPFAYPVAVKALSDRLPHKTDVGAVVLDVPNEQGVREAVSRITTSVRAADPAISLTRFLIQPMVVYGVADVLVGYRLSPLVGPVVVLAAGGVQTELYNDSAIRLAPTQPEEVARMVGEIRALRVLQGFRGAEAGDVEGLVAAVTALARLVEDQPDVLEAEINPLRIGPKGSGVTALDALVRRRSVGTGVYRQADRGYMNRPPVTSATVPVMYEDISDA